MVGKVEDAAADCPVRHQAAVMRPNALLDPRSSRPPRASNRHPGDEKYENKTFEYRERPPKFAIAIRSPILKALW